MRFKHGIRRFLWRYGIDVSRFHAGVHPIARRRKLIDTYSIDTILDVGANTGQFAMELRKDIGFRGKIISFEPLSSAFELLKRNSGGDHLWDTINFGLGDQDGDTVINVACNSVSSSMLGMLPSHEISAPESKYVGTEVIRIMTLDSVFDHHCSNSSNIYLKVDTQGFERQVLGGANKSLARIDTVQLEISLVPLYEGAPLFDEIYLLMVGKGYTPVAIEPGHSDLNSGQLLQADIVFHRF